MSGAHGATEALPGLSDLRARLHRLDGGGYGGYKRLRDGAWTIGAGTTLAVERVQADPYAPPSRLAVTLTPEAAGVPAELCRTADRRRALADHLARLLAARLAGRSAFRVDAGGQEVLDRTACRVAPDGAVRARLGVQLPARGRRVLGRQAAALLADDLPDAIRDSLRWPAIDAAQARASVATVEDAVALRAQLGPAGLVAFVADGAVLPRRSGVDDRPLAGGGVVGFTAPPSLRVTLEAPHAGPVAGMGVPGGVTLVVGGGFHGKSTLLRALERGVYDHVPGDGREQVVARADAVKIRAEDGRRVERVDVSAFVGSLPSGSATSDFSTPNASGSTSQAAAIVEAVEAGAGLLLVDEDTSATNLMIRDHRMQALVAKDREPLTPFCDLVRSLHRDHAVSTVLVVGGSGDYFDVADTVVWMDAYRPREVTDEARSIAARLPGRRAEAAGFPAVRQRVVDPASVDARTRGKIKTKGRGTDTLRFGDEDIELAAVEQLVDPSQTAGIAQALIRLAEGGLLDGQSTLRDGLDRLDAALGDDPVDALQSGYAGDLALPRRFEIAAALNRLRTLRVAGLR